MSIINKLEEKFTKLPGIGPKQAKRFVHYLLTRSDAFIDELVFLLKKLKEESKLCSACFRYFGKEYENGTSFCPICADKNRDPSILMVVSRDVDVEPIERSGVYEGLYFVMGGILTVLEGDPQKKIRIKEIKETIKDKTKNKGLKEVILAFPANPDGDNTADYIKKELEEFAEKFNFKISKLGRGLSTGLEIEYSDGETIKNALGNRK